jgi:hypothetical protein
MDTITLEQVKAACRKAYDEKRLLAQNTPIQYGYSRDGFVCAIGAALSPATLDMIEEDSNLENLQEAIVGMYEFNHSIAHVLPEEEGDLFTIQGVHDQWLSSQNNAIESFSEEVKRRHILDAKDHEARFLELIDYPASE